MVLLDPAARNRRIQAVNCALLCLLFAAGPAHALEPSQRIQQYAHNIWDRERGSLPASPLALTQTPDGTLWIGTDSGLLRFDGIRFQSWKAPADQQLASEYITALAAAADGSLWIGTRAGLSHWQDSSLRNFPIGPIGPIGKGAIGPGVTAILGDSTGTIWAAAAGYGSGGLCRMEGGHLRCFTAADGLPGPAVYSLMEDRAKNLWVGSLGLCQWKAGPLPVVPSPDPREMVYAIAEDPQGGVWVAGNGLKRLAGGHLALYPILAEHRNIQPRSLLVDRDGALWIGTRGQGLLRLYRGRTDRFTHQDGLSSDLVTSLFEDREGNIWAGTAEGLDQFRQFAVNAISGREGLPPGMVSSVFPAQDGGVWVGTSGGLSRIAYGEGGVYGQRRELPSASGASASMMGTFQEQGGRLWTLTNQGLAYSEGGRFHPLRLPGGQAIAFTAAAEDCNHSVWFADPGNGLLQVRDARIVDVVPWSKFEGKKPWALESSPGEDGVWVGFAEGEAARYQPGRPVSRLLIPGTGDAAAIIDLHSARDGALWIVTRESLIRFQAGRLDTLTMRNGLPCGHLQAMVEDDSGAFWLSTGCGIVRLSAADLSQWSAHPASKIRARVYDNADGLRWGPKITGYFRRAVKSSDGRLWFAAFGGLAMVNPRHLPENRLIPPVKIEEIAAGDIAYPPHADPRLPARTKELRIDYTAMALTEPEKTRFRYRLDGFDSDWHEAAGRRQAVYTNLPPNHYTFRVIAANSDGVWNRTGAISDFSIDRAYYQTVWFRLLCLSGLLLMLWAFHRLRLRQMAVQIAARFQERLAERNRIAGEMHDTLLQNLTGCALQLAALSKSAAIPAQERDRVLQIRQDTEHCMRDAREFVWDLRAPTLREENLVQSLREAGEEITRGAGVQFRVTVSGDQWPAPARLQQHLLRIVQEFTRNAVRYSFAKQIEMSLAYAGDGIRLHISDDGCGFDLEQASRKPGHFGLAIMQERAAQIGAEIKISSTPGHGTEVDIIAPMADAPS